MIRQRKKNSGFTLLELMISLTILAVIVVLVFGGLRVSVRAWEKGEQAIERQQRYRTVLNLIRRQLISVIDVSEELQDIAFIFMGETSFLQCVSATSLVPGSKPAKVRVLYRVMPEDEGQNRLVFYEQFVFSMTEEEKSSDPESIPEDAYYELLSGISMLEFSYLPSTSFSLRDGETPLFDGDSALPWQPVWEEKGLPMAIRVRFKGNEDDPPVDMVIPILKNYQEDG